MRPVGGCLLALAVAAVSACGGGTSTSETAPPPTPLPSFPTPTVTLVPSETPEPPVAETPDPETAWQMLRASIPEAILPYCQRERAATGVLTGRGSLAAAVCDPPAVGGTLTVAYRLFNDPESMDAAFDALRRDAARGGETEGPGCGSGPGPERILVGRKLCYTDADRAAVMWTNDLAFVLATAVRSDLDWAALERSWKSAGPITP